MTTAFWKYCCLLLPATLLAGCSQPQLSSGPTAQAPQEQRKGPELVDAASKADDAARSLADLQRRTRESNGFPAGQPVHFAWDAMNVGQASQGAKVVLHGSALQQGVLGPPQSLQIQVSAPGQAKSMANQATGNFAMTAPGVFSVSLPDLKLPVNGIVSIALDCNAQTPGEGMLEFEVDPLDSSGTSTAKQEEKVKVVAQTGQQNTSTEGSTQAGGMTLRQR